MRLSPAHILTASARTHVLCEASHLKSARQRKRKEKVFFPPLLRTRGPTSIYIIATHSRRTLVPFLPACLPPICLRAMPSSPPPIRVPARAKPVRATHALACPAMHVAPALISRHGAGTGAGRGGRGLCDAWVIGSARGVGVAGYDDPGRGRGRGSGTEGLVWRGREVRLRSGHAGYERNVQGRVWLHGLERDWHVWRVERLVGGIGAETLFAFLPVLIALAIGMGVCQVALRMTFPYSPSLDSEWCACSASLRSH